MDKKKYTLAYHAGIQRYLSERRCVFHMPGHKGRFLQAGIPDTILPPEIFPYDITASGDREDLYNPKTFLKESLDNLTDIYGTVRSYYLVNGSTGGNQAALIATLNPGDKILMPRHVHKLIYGALVVTQAKPVYMEFGDAKNSHPLCSGVDPEKIEWALQQDPAIKVVYLVNPSYTGVCSDIEAIVRIAHTYQKIIIVDEAHGAHFFFHPELPPSAITAGADMVIQSTHKTLNALSQTALLHICTDKIDVARVELVIGMFQTTSPNTLFLLSLEAAVMQMVNQGYQLLDTALGYAREIRYGLQASPLYCLKKTTPSKAYIAAMDETKLYLDVSSLGLTGYAAKALLGKTYKIEAELADYKHVLFSLTIADSSAEIKKLEASLLRFSAQCYGTPYADIQLPSLPTTSDLTPAQVFYAEHEDVLLANSVGRVCAEMITPYPPGIPTLMPGEIISYELIEYIQRLIAMHASFGGSKYKHLSHIMVVKN